MPKRIYIFLAIFGAVGLYSFQNRTLNSSPFLGTWKCVKIQHPMIEEIEVVDPRKENFDSQITFSADNTWTKITEGQTQTGIYEQKKPNKIEFFEKNDHGELESIWSMRWPKGKFDPNALTPEVDFIFPELMLVKSLQGDTVKSEVDCIYVPM